MLRSGKSHEGSFAGASGEMVELNIGEEIGRFSLDGISSIRFHKDREARRSSDPGDRSTGHEVMVKVGVVITVACSRRLLSGSWREGRVFRSKRAQSFKNSDTLLAPAQSDVSVKLVQRESGAAEIVLAQMVVSGERLSIRT